MTSAREHQTRQERSRFLMRTGLYLLLLGSFVLGGTLIIAYDALIPSSSQVALVEGQVAPRDVVAPRSLQYESDVMSQAKREAEIAAVRPVYDPPDSSVANEQVQLARQILDFIENVRYDDFSTLEQKQQDINSITALSLEPEVSAALLEIDDDSAWRAIDAQVIRLLERVMNTEVRDDNIQSKRDNLPNLINASYSESEVEIITAIVSDLIRPNTYYNVERTDEARTQAAEQVPVEMRTFAKGQMIIREGEIATAAHIEALDRFGLLQVTERKTSRFFGSLLAMFLTTSILGVYIRRFNPAIFNKPRFMVLLSIMFLIFLAGARIFDTESDIPSYYYPAPALAFLVTTVVSAELAIVVILTLAALVGFMTGNSLEFAVLIAMSSTLGILSLERTERLNSFLLAGIIAGLAGGCVGLIFEFEGGAKSGAFDMLLHFFGAVVGGLFSTGLAFVGLYLITYFMNIPTSLKIFELMQPNHPLLQRLLREAPGTYQHSLQVANLAELGAQQINANASLLRVAAMYHDVGKILNPHFFVENQADGVNPHTQLDEPSQSARIIIGHVHEGERLARHYRLPSRVRDFVLEHHGTTQVMYFYRQALEQAQKNGSEIDISLFTYPGPRPQSRETAILMLADGCESSVRARRPQSKQDIQETVDYIFEARLKDHQLDDSGLTLNDLRVLRDAFLTALQGVFHPRIAYPGTPGQTPELPPAEPARLLSARQTGEMAQVKARHEARPE